MCSFVLAMSLTFQFKQEKGYGKKKAAGKKLLMFLAFNSSPSLNFLEVVYNLEIRWFVCWFLLLKKELSLDRSMKLGLDSSRKQWILLEALMLKKY